MRDAYHPNRGRSQGAGATAALGRVVRMAQLPGGERARDELEAVLDDEPGWITRLWIEPFTLVVAAERD